MYTTRLLAIIDDVMPRRQRIVLGAIVVFLVLASIGGSLSSRPAPEQVQPLPPVFIVATPTAAPAAEGLAKQAARLGPIAPSPAPSTSTLAPTLEPVILVAPVEVAPPEPTATPTKAPMPTAPPRWTIR